MSKYNIIIADDEPLIRMDIKEMIESLGHNVIADVSNGKEAVNIARVNKPDLLILDIKMDEMNGLEAAEIIYKEDIAPVILFTAYSQSSLIKEAKEKGVMYYLVKPVSEKELAAAIELVLGRYSELKEAKEKANIAEEKLKNRKIIDKAKGILMNSQNITEEQAYKKIRSISMNKRISMKKVAEMIIFSSEI